MLVDLEVWNRNFILFTQEQLQLYLRSEKHFWIFWRKSLLHHK